MTPLAHAGELGRVSAPMAAMSFACRMCGKPLPAKAWGGAECSRCGSVSMLALPTAETTSRPGAATASIQASRAGRCALRCADRYLGIVKRRVAAGLLIDVGTSTSPFPNLAEEAGFEVTVLGQMLPKGLSPSIRFREGSVEGEALLAQLEGVFDVVTAWAVIERLPDPVFSAKVLSRMCRPGGKIFLSTPETGTFLTDHSIGRHCKGCALHFFQFQFPIARSFCQIHDLSTHFKPRALKPMVGLRRSTTPPTRRH